MAATRVEYETEQEWLAARRIGGSTIAMLMGDSDYGGPFIGWLELTDRMPPSKHQYAIARGSYNESFILRYAISAGLVPAMEHVDRVIYHGDVEWETASPDAEGDECGAEVKCRSSRQAHKYGKDKFPASDEAQCRWNMMLADVPVWYLIVEIDSQEPVVYTIERDYEWDRRARGVAAKFWHDHIVTDEPPEPDGFDECGRWLCAKYPQETGRIINLETYEKADDVAELALSYCEARDAIARAKLHQKEVTQKLQVLMEINDGFKGVVRGKRITATMKARGGRGVRVPYIQVKDA